MSCYSLENQSLYLDLYVIGQLNLRIEDLLESKSDVNRLQMVLYILKKHGIPVEHYFDLYPPLGIHSESISNNLFFISIFEPSTIDIEFYENRLKKRYGEDVIERMKKILSKVKNMNNEELFKECLYLAKKAKN